MSKPVFYLKDIIPNGETAIASISGVLAQKLAILDCSEVELLTNSQLKALFTVISVEWKTGELAEVFKLETLTPSFAQQLTEYCQKREPLQGAGVRYQVSEQASPDNSLVSPDNSLVSPDNTNLTPNTQHPTPNTRNLTPNTRNLTPNTQHPTPNTQHPTPNTRNLIPNTRNLTPDTPLHPIKILDQVIAEYRDYLLTEFRAKDPQLKQALEKAIDQPKFLAQAPFYSDLAPKKTDDPPEG